MLMKQISVALVAAIAMAGPALADGKTHGKKHHKERHGVIYTQSHCPPGLAKKSPACVPPGLAKDRVHCEVVRDDRVVIYRQGDVIRRDYILIEDPLRYGLMDGTYYRAGDYVYRVDRNTHEVLALMGAVNAILN